MTWRPRFSLAVLLLLVTATAFAFADIRRRAGIAKQQRDATAWLSSLHVGLARYDWQDQAKGYADPTKTYAESSWLTRVIGPEYFQSMEELSVYDPMLDDLSPIASQTSLKFVDINSDTTYDLRPIAGLCELRHLVLSGKHIDSLRPLHGLPKLEYLLIIGATVPTSELSAFRAARPDVHLEMSP